MDNALKSAFYAKHIELVSKSRLADFAGYLMPLWFSSISAESFLNNLTTNDISALIPGESQYCYALDVVVR